MRMPSVNNYHPQPRSSASPSEGNDMNSDKEVQKLTIMEESAKMAVEDADSALEKAHETDRAVRSKVWDAKAVKDAKEKRLEAAIAGDKEKVKEAETELEESEQKLAKLELEQKMAERTLKAAQKTKTDAEAAVMAIAHSIADSAREIPKAQADRSREIASNRRKVVV